MGFHVLMYTTGERAGWLVRDIAGDIRRFAALERAKEFEVAGPVVPIGPIEEADLNWREREGERMRNGEYARLNEQLERHCLPEHFAHVSKQDNTAIAYTKTEADGVRGKIKRIRIAAYLEQYAPRLSKDEITRLEKLQTTGNAVSSVLWARTPSEVERVYTHYSSNHSGVASSCMRYDKSHFGVTVHPTAVYGGGDLCIAYLADEDGRCIARSVVFEKEKIYSRVYGSDRSVSELMSRLGQAGFKKSDGYFGDGDYDNVSHMSLAGARIPFIKSPDRPDHIVMPYIDEGGWGEVDEAREWITLHARDDTNKTNVWVDVASTSGTVAFYPCRCQACGRPAPEGSDKPTIYVSEDKDAQPVPGCVNCLGSTFVCYGTKRTYSAHRVQYARVIIDGVNQIVGQQYAAERFGKCDSCGVYGDQTSIFKLRTMHESTAMCAECAPRNAFWCAGAEELVVSDYKIRNTEQPQRKKHQGKMFRRALSLFAPDLATRDGGIYAPLAREYEARKGHPSRRGERVVAMVARDSGSPMQAHAEVHRFADMTAIISAWRPEYDIVSYSADLELRILKPGSFVTVTEPRLGLTAAPGSIAENAGDGLLTVVLDDGRTVTMREASLTLAPPRKGYRKPPVPTFAEGDRVIFSAADSERFGLAGTVTRVTTYDELIELTIQRDDGRVSHAYSSRVMHVQGSPVAEAQTA